MWYDAIIDRGIVPDFLMKLAVRATLSGHKPGMEMGAEERLRFPGRKRVECYPLPIHKKAIISID